MAGRRVEAPTIRCAIYTRKSTEEGLEQEFNSLDAQREAGRIDCVVVYKVDRLSRSLLDFTRIMEAIERRGVSFVSVSQSFFSGIRHCPYQIIHPADSEVTSGLQFLDSNQIMTRVGTGSSGQTAS